MYGIRRRYELWHIISIGITLVYIIFLIVPMFRMLKESVVTAEDGFSFQNYFTFFSQAYYLNTIINSFKLSAATTFFSLIIGVLLAYVCNLYRIKGHSVLQVLIILSSMSAPFVGAYAWILLLGRSGLITGLVKMVFDIKLPSIYGFNGVVLVLTTRLYPLVFMYVSGALKSMDNSLLEAAQNMGCGGFRRFFRIVMPLCMPSVLASALMVFMRAMADFGTPLLIGEGYRTFPVEIYKQYVGETSQNHGFAATISVIAIITTAMLFLIQKFVSNKYSFHIPFMSPIIPKKPKILLNILIHVYAYIIVLISMLPQAYLVYCSFRKTNAFGNFMAGFSLESYSRAWKFTETAIPNTLILGGISLVIVVLMSILIAYIVVRRKNFLNNTIDTLSMLPYIIPGSVVGIALVITFSSGPMVLTGTMAIMIVAMCIRRIPYTIRSSVAVLQQIPITTEEAAISLGASKIKTFFRVTTPMMASGIISGAVLSWVSIITELSASIMLYSAKTQTLTLSIYVLVSRGTDGPACAVSTILLFFTVLSLVIFMLVSKNKDIMMKL